MSLLRASARALPIGKEWDTLMRGGGGVGGGGDVEAAAAFVAAFAGLADDAGHPQGPQECAEDEGGDKEHGPETGFGFRIVAHAREIFHQGEGSTTGKLGNIER